MEKTVDLICSICGVPFKKPRGEYNRRIRLGKTRFMCSLSCGVTESNRITQRKGNSKYLISNNKRDDYSPFRWFLSRIAYRRAKKGNSDITLEYLKDLWDEQKGICSYTGNKMILPINSQGFPKKNPSNASLDRIDAKKGYLQKNVQFISLIANYAKNAFSDEDLIVFCKQVTEWAYKGSREKR